MRASGLATAEAQPSAPPFLARGAGRSARRGGAAVTCAKGKKREYGSGRARLPGLEEMMAAMQGQGSSATPASTSGLAGPPSRAGGSSSAAAPTPGSSGGSARRTAEPASSGGSSAGGASDAAPSLGDYLKFGRLLGEKPQQVQQQLALGGTQVLVDEQSADYLQSWEEEEAEAYAMFEAVLRAQAGRPAGAAATAAAKKLERNKARLSAAASAAQLARGARREQEAGLPLTAAQRKLARNKTAGGGMGASMRASLEALMGTAGIEGDADDAFELVGRPLRPGAALAGKPARPGDLEPQLRASGA